MSMEFLFFALFAISVLTNLTVQGIKALADKKSANYSANVLAATTSVVVSVVVSAGYLIWTETALNAKIAVELIALAYLSFLVATNGYDKVIQAIKQIKAVISHDCGYRSRNSHRSAPARVFDWMSGMCSNNKGIL